MWVILYPARSSRFDAAARLRKIKKELVRGGESKSRKENVLTLQDIGRLEGYSSRSPLYLLGCSSGIQVFTDRPSKRDGSTVVMPPVQVLRA